MYKAQSYFIDNWIRISQGHIFFYHLHPFLGNKLTFKLIIANDIQYVNSKEKQADYKKQLIKRFGGQVKDSIAQSHQNVKNWSKAD